MSAQQDRVEIVARIATATDGSRELDALVAGALGWKRVNLLSPRDLGWQSPGGAAFYSSQLPAFTTSIDAITAEIKARGMRVAGCGDPRGPERAWARVETAGDAQFSGVGGTLSMALTVALLRAIAAPEGDAHG